MTERTLTIAEIILIAGTRVVLDTGIGLLLAGRLNKDQRKAAGRWPWPEGLLRFRSR
jgi:hypothetical protein